MNKKDELLNSKKYEIYGDRKEHYFNLKQETIYMFSIFLDKIFGGRWRLLKLGKDTPANGMFCHWTKLDNSSFSGYKEVLIIEKYEETGVDTNGKYLNNF